MDGYKKICKIFDCKKYTLRDWIKRYNSSKNLTRRNRKPIQERYDSLKKTLDELETMYDDYIERFFYTQFNSLIVTEKLPK